LLKNHFFLANPIDNFLPLQSPVCNKRGVPSWNLAGGIRGRFFLWSPLLFFCFFFFFFLKTARLNLGFIVSAFFIQTFVAGWRVFHPFLYQGGRYMFPLRFLPIPLFHTQFPLSKRGTAHFFLSVFFEAPFVNLYTTPPHPPFPAFQRPSESLVTSHPLCANPTSLANFPTSRPWPQSLIYFLPN